MQKSGKMHPELLYKLASGEFPKCVWTFYAVTWVRLQSWKFWRFMAYKRADQLRSLKG